MSGVGRRSEHMAMDSAVGGDWIDTGALTFVLIASALLAWPVSAFLLKLYRGAVVAAMNTRGSHDAPAEVADVIARGEPLGSAEYLYHRSVAGRRRALTAYAAGGFVFAVLMAACFLLSGDLAVGPVRLATLTGIYAWPFVLTWNLVCRSPLKTSLGVAGIYVLAFTVIAAVGLSLSPNATVGSLIVVLLVTNIPPTILLSLFLSRRVRAVGPLVLVFLMIGVFGANAAVSLVGSSDEGIGIAADFGLAMGLGSWGTLLSIVSIGFALFGFVGWALLRRLAVSYEQKKITDQSLTVDAVWLLFGLVYAIGIAPAGLVWILAGSVAFGAFKLTYKFIFRARASARHEVARGPKLLLLRVFSLGKRSETLFDIFGAQWRYVGSTRMIAGPDLATSAIEPDEFLQFAGGKLKTLFVDGSEAFRTRLSSLDEAPDFDGRHRVNEFFCYDDTWRMVLRRLAASSDAVLMDLRGFSAQTPGCEFEIKELFHLIPVLSNTR